MLKNIRLHIDKDENKQKILDEKLAQHIIKTQHKNINAFQRNIPSLIPHIDSSTLSSHSLFCNRFGEYNIVDYGIGRTLYGFHPKTEVLEQVSRLESHCPKFTLSATSNPTSNHKESITAPLNFKQLESYVLRCEQSAIPHQIECLVILGCGLGLHLESLIANHNIKYLIVYEPQLQYFQCSVLATDWNKIFEVAKTQGTALFIQIEKDGRDLVSDIVELAESYPLKEVYLYKHYNHDVFNSIEKAISQRSWTDIKQNRFTIGNNNDYAQYIPTWTAEIALNQHTSITSDSAKFLHNLKAFEKYFPAIYQQYKDYVPKNWLPIVNHKDEINLINKNSLSSWYGKSPKQDCILNFQNFNSQPNKDGLVLGYSGTKLAHYTHYKFVKKTEKLLKEAEEETGELPETVASIIMFGLGSGYQLDKLLIDHNVEKLFVCEPNPDFFYASLHAIDWMEIFEKIEKNDARIYLNIGDDGTNLFRDLLNQFHSIGPYILNNTYFYQSYYNSSLNTAIAQLREQLQVVISMGEYFDHAYYGIAHTKEAMKRLYPALINNPSKKLDFESKEVPVFIVGNGPSLDSTIDAIKEWQDSAIIVCCGTALQPLYKNGIVPDFHAEIEQNRSTFDWATLIGDLDYLQQITLLSCNGIHPDTCSLYKDVLIAFKEGESSTVSALNVIGFEHFEVLQHAFPTVSNFVCDLISTLGFNNIYLLGVDLGFIDVKHHHSKASAYYKEDGEEFYDYSEKNNTSLVVQGNFRPTVNTKHEFKVSRQIIEQITVKKPQYQTFYNCSDGAKIANTVPLKVDELLVVATPKQKQQSLSQIKTEAFNSTHTIDFNHRYEDTYSSQKLQSELDEFRKILSKDVANLDDVNNIINSQKEMLFSSYKTGKSLLFYYLYGTVNYANALLLKLALCDTKTDSISDKVTQCIEYWKDVIDEIADKLANQFQSFDNSNFQDLKRERLLQGNFVREKKLLIVTNSLAFADSAKWTIDNMFPWPCETQICSPQQVSKHLDYHYVIYNIDRELAYNEAMEWSFHQFPNTGTIQTLFIESDFTKHPISQLSDNDNISLLFKLPNLTATQKQSHNAFAYASIAIRACFDLTTASIVLPKIKLADTEDLDTESLLSELELYPPPEAALMFTFYSTIPLNRNFDNTISIGGERPEIITDMSNPKLFVYKFFPLESILKDREVFIGFVDTAYSENIFEDSITFRMDKK